MILNTKELTLMNIKRLNFTQVQDSKHQEKIEI